MDTVLLSELTWPEVKGLLGSGAVDTAVIAIGSTEQHGHHLPLATDSLIAGWVGEQLARRLGRALLAPPIVVGRSEHHMAFAGSITLREETLAALIEDYVASLAHHGFKKIVLVPTHGGNFGPLKAITESLRAAHPQLKIVEYTDLLQFTAVLNEASAELGISQEVSGAHAGESEASIVLALRPELVRMDRAIEGYVGPFEEALPKIFSQGIGAVHPEGIWGDPRPATAESGRVYLRRLMDHLVEVIEPQLA